MTATLRERVASTPKKVKVSVAAVTVTAAAAAATFALTGTPEESAPKADPPKAEAQYAVQAPKDGQLLVGRTRIDQLAGSCEDTVCRYQPQDGKAGDPPVVTVPSGTQWLPMTAKDSTTFSVSAYTPNDPQETPQIGSAPKRLLLEDAPRGSHRVSVSGDKGGIWQFTLKVTDRT